MKKILFFLIVLYHTPVFADIPRVILLSEKPGSMELYQSVTFKFMVPGLLKNPFDPDEISLNANIITSEKDSLIIPGFFAGDSVWYVKYTPQKTGFCDIRFYLSYKDSVLEIDSTSINITESDRDGFIRLDSLSNYNFRFDSGKIFRGIGENVCWAGDFEYYFQKLNENDCNFTRIWMCPWGLSLEWEETGLGRYNLENAARLDSILILAEKYDIYIMLCFGYHGVIQRGQGHFNENKWAKNPYSLVNGGPCKFSFEFFTDSLAKSYYKKRLRYLVARYGHNTRIQSWEFWNEVDLTTGKPNDVIAWHWEMGAYLRNIDPYKHLISSSFSSSDYPDLWYCKYIDFSQIHLYNDPDLVYATKESIRWHTKLFNKPHVIGEYGVEYRGGPETIAADSQFVGIHNGLWAGFISPTPIIPMTWWWDEVIDPQDLYFEFRNIGKIWNSSVRDTSHVSELDIVPYIKDAIWAETNQDTITDLVLHPAKSWGKNTHSIFEIGADGQISNQAYIPGILFGSKKMDFRNPPEFIVTYKNNGRFLIHVNHISMHGHLRIYLNDSLALDQALPLHPDKGDWEDIKWVEEYNRYQGRYNKIYAIDVPMGNHRIRVQNDSLDWFEISYYKFENCGFVEQPGVDASGIMIDQDALFWVRNQNYSWKNVQARGYDDNIITAEILLPQFRKNCYKIEWWSPDSGRIIARDMVTVSDDAVLLLELPPFNKDIAGRVIRVEKITQLEKYLTLLIILIIILTVLSSIQTTLKTRYD